jgi:hypothetical protein
MNQYNPHENYSYIYHKPELIQPIQEVVELLEAQCLPVPWPTADTDHGHGDSTRKKRTNDAIGKNFNEPSGTIIKN